LSLREPLNTIYTEYRVALTAFGEVQVSSEAKAYDAAANIGNVHRNARSGAVSNSGESRIRILIIDRHEAVRRALNIRLGAHNQLEVVGVAAGPDEALARMAFFRPDVIILGLQNGSDDVLMQTAFAVQNMVAETAVVIILAPYVDAVERELLLQAGAKRYLLKHINSQKLIQEIESVASTGANV
jgi:CheY-like chemotaxis protein